MVATDRSAEALALARANLAGIGPAATRVTLSQGSWFDAVDPAIRGAVDLVISNPPYVPDGAELPAEVRDWEPTGALFAGPDGMDDLIHLLVNSRAWLRPGGWLVLENRTDVGTVVAALTGLAQISGPWIELVAFFRKLSTMRVRFDLIADKVFPREDPRSLPQ